MKKVLLLDTSDIPYGRALSKSLSKYADLTVVSKYGNSNWNGIPYFYKYSENMKRGRIRNVIRGIEYIIGYKKTLKLIKKEKFDIVHIQWAMMPSLDIKFWKKMKPYIGKLVFTAHDVVPHNPTEKKMMNNNLLYETADTIIVHGEFCKNEMKMHYPKQERKVYVQKHGVQSGNVKKYTESTKKDHENLLNMISSNTLVFGAIGQIGWYKGLDILLNAWNRFNEKGNLILLIAGKPLPDYEKEFEMIKKKCSNMSTVYLYDKKFSDEEETLFYSLCDIIVLPYRTASMSGVLFSAAEYNKTVLSTKAGCLAEALEPISNEVFYCEPSEDSIGIAIGNILAIKDVKNVLKNKGKRFSEYIHEFYSWDTIAFELVRDCYNK